MAINIVVAVAQNGVIGRDNQLIWHLPKDLRYFKNLTTGHAVVMGRKTYESIGRPLPNRVNIIISRDSDYQAIGCQTASSLADGIAKARQTSEEVFVIGGAQIYKQALALADRVYLTEVHGDFEGDTFFNALPKDQWKEISRETHQPDEKHMVGFSFVVLERC
jgi:dihydrofolate reductase